MLASESNPREAIGSNNPPLARSISVEEGDFALSVTAFLQDEYQKQPTIVQALLDEATALMRDETGKLRDIPDDDVKGKVASLIKRMRDAAKVLEAAHGTEKQPYLRGGQACDQFFFGLIDKLQKRAKANNPGGADVLGRLLTEYDNRKLAAETERRRLIAEEETRKAIAAQAERDRLAREAYEAEAAAARARNPERKEEKVEAARDLQQQASAAAVEAEVTTQAAEAAHVEMLARPADIMRERHGDGTLTGMGTEKYAEIEDRTKLDMAALWPHIPLDALGKALNQWARLTDFRQPMEGAAIGRRNKSRVR